MKEFYDEIANMDDQFDSNEYDYDYDYDYDYTDPLDDPVLDYDIDFTIEYDYDWQPEPKEDWEDSYEYPPIDSEPYYETEPWMNEPIPEPEPWNHQRPSHHKGKHHQKNRKGGDDWSNDDYARMRQEKEDFITGVIVCLLWGCCACVCIGGAICAFGYNLLRLKQLHCQRWRDREDIKRTKDEAKDLKRQIKEQDQQAWIQY